MKNLWNPREAAQCQDDLALRVYSSRLLGRDRTLVLHGGGNTSVKVRQHNVFGEDEDILLIKGSGCDLETITPAGFAPCRLAHLLRLSRLETLSDLQMMAELQASLANPGRAVDKVARASSPASSSGVPPDHSSASGGGTLPRLAAGTAVLQFVNGFANPGAPAPSVEAILHALLPARFVDHTHADALLAVMNSPGGHERVVEIYGQSVVILPYVMAGFKLARLCAELFPKLAGPDTVGMVLMNHGLFTFGDTAKISYDRMIELVTRAEEYLARHQAWNIHAPAAAQPPPPVLGREIAALRREISIAAGAPMILQAHCDAPCLAFARRPDVADLSQRGAATPDHVIRTKRVPLVGRDVAAFRDAYVRYFQKHAAGRPLTMLDPAPRVVLDPALGLCAAGRTTAEAIIAGDIYRQTINIILRAEALGRWQALPEDHLFDMEYWDLQQAKLRRMPKPLLFTGEAALVTGAASGIGKACVQALLERGAAVVGLDFNPAILRLHERPDYRGLVCDLTDRAQVAGALEQAVRAFGGLDILVLNAGIFPKGCPISEMTDETWRKVMSINLDANLALLRECHPFLKLAPNGGRVAVIGSKNVPAPGPGAAAYSASKAAMNQLARVTALEWGPDHIRINSVHPNQVFDTGLWTPEVLESRARHYGLTVQQYKTNNVLQTEIKSADVAALAVEMCGPLFSKTTGAQVPVDGGNERVI